jgi:signal peptidase I
MIPTLKIGDRIIIATSGYAIRRGDIVVFKRPPADIGTNDAELVERIIGLPDETISSRGRHRPHKRPTAPRVVAASPQGGMRRERREHHPYQDPIGPLLRDGRLSWGLGR